MCVSWCFLRWFLIIFTYLCFMHIVFQELVVFFCSGLFFNGIRSGCCPDVNCIRAWGLEENMYHKQTRWIRGGNGGARHVTYRGEEPRATSTVMATLPAVHIHYSEYIGLSFTLHTTSRLFIRHVLVKGKTATLHERTIYNLVILASSHDPTRSSEFIYPCNRLPISFTTHLTIHFIITLFWKVSNSFYFSVSLLFPPFSLDTETPLSWVVNHILYSAAEATPPPHLFF